MERYLRREAYFGRNLRAYDDDIVVIEWSFERSDGRLFAVLRDGGEAPKVWTDVSLEKRLSLFVSLLRLHQKAGILHGDIAPRNCVLAPPSPGPSLGPARWIDLSKATADHKCRDRGCTELKWAAVEMGLVAAEEAGDIAAIASSEGLTW
ncbi:hypothetical protein Rt10032_c05g2406 [Rhodotorula toruloides]|uniref:Protein kinase domain-containing protein n=1 Tax=Rhodotorula toruloides TaxID=5286 RepID=A0A511KDB9_RHOTO|nr:hypothetical protein Rt10032_c05g2406 [Rhodotorula toruloides]